MSAIYHQASAFWWHVEGFYSLHRKLPDCYALTCQRMSAYHYTQARALQEIVG